MLLHIFFPFLDGCSSVLYWQCPQPTTWVVTACPTDQISRDNPRKLLVTKHIVPSPHWSTGPLTFWLKFTHSVTNNFPTSKLLGRQKKRQLLSSLWLVAQSTLCSYPAPLPRQRAALRSKWCADHSGWVQLCPCHWISDCPSMSLPFVFINEVFSTRNMESLAITPPQKCLQVIDDRPGNDAKDVMNNK